MKFSLTNVVSVLLLILMIGCSKKNEKAFKCQFTYDQGYAATRLPDELKESQFGKYFAYNHLKSVAQASGIETVNYLETHGNVTVYQVANPPQDCPFYNTLKKAHFKLLSAWKGIEKYSGENARVLGTYFAKNSILVDDVNVDPTILMRVDTDRWTLLHEFLHHLFESEAAKNGSAQTVIFTKSKQNKFELDQTVNLIKRSFDLKEKIALAEKLVRLSSEQAEYQLRFLRHTSLEEMTIETEMLENYPTYSFVPQNFENSIAYIEASEQQSRKKIEKIQEIIDRTREEIEKNPIVAKSVDMALLRMTEAKLQKVRQELPAAMLKAEKLYLRRVASHHLQTLARFFPPEIDHAKKVGLKSPCGHATAFKNGDKFFEVNVPDNLFQ